MDEGEALGKKRARFLIVVITGLMICANVLLGAVIADQSGTAMKTLIDKRMLDIVNSAAALLDGDDLGALKAEDVGKTEAYQRIYDTLRVFEMRMDLAYIYCLREEGNKRFVFTVDPDPDRPAEYGEEIEYTEALYWASMGLPRADQEPYSDSWGRFYSAYSPVFDSQGRVAGIVAADFNADWYDEQIAMQRRSIVICVVFSTLMCVALGMVVASRTRALDTALRDVERMRSARDYYRLHSEIDELTGLLNKATAERMATEHLESLPPERQAAFYMLDLDRFKTVNDTYGHDFGDKVLVSFADRLRYIFGSDALLGRFGGDEFVVMAFGESVRETAERNARTLLRSTLQMEIGDVKQQISVSVGIAIAPQDGASYKELFHAADHALYAVKSQGRNGYSIGREEIVHHGGAQT